MLKAPEVISSDKLDKRLSECRVAHIRYYDELKDKFPMIDKTMYHKANASTLGVKIRRFRQLFESCSSDLKAIKAKKIQSQKSSGVKEARQSEVHFQQLIKRNYCTFLVRFAILDVFSGIPF